MSGEWKRRRVEYSGTGNRKGRPTRKVHLNDRATPRLYPDAEQPSSAAAAALNDKKLRQTNIAAAVGCSDWNVKLATS